MLTKAVAQTHDNLYYKLSGVWATTIRNGLPTPTFVSVRFP